MPFIADWRAGPIVTGGFSAWLRLDDDSLFAGHYPGAPILPGTFLIEALVQATCNFLGEAVGLKEVVTCRFQSPLRPGDEVSARFRFGETKPTGTLVEVSATGREPAAELTLLIGPVSDADLDSASATSPWLRDAAATRVLNEAFVAQALPHRPPLLLVDSALLLVEPGTRPRLLGRKAITSAEPCFADGTATDSYPSSLVLESFCQACGLLRAATAKTGEARDATKVPVMAKLAGLRLLGEAVPGAELEHHVELVVRAPEGAVFSGRTESAGRVLLEVARVIAALAPATT
jgi:3-hydroxymyristoyl/3-hydroxydecanoyl-(acyl carrier protein) dehydratase